MCVSKTWEIAIMSQLPIHIFDIMEIVDIVLFGWSHVAGLIVLVHIDTFKWQTLKINR